MSTCTLCNLPTPNPPVTEEETDGFFCCTGCLHVYQLLRETDEDLLDIDLPKSFKGNRADSATDELPGNFSEAFLKVNGMHCTTCETFIKRLVERHHGIYRCEASYSSEMVKVYYDQDRLKSGNLPELVSGYGYNAYLPEYGPYTSDKTESAGRLVLGGIFSLIGLILYVLFLYPTYVTGKGIVELSSAESSFIIAHIWVMTTFVMVYTGYPILRGAWISLSVMRTNMNLLVALAALSAYLYSVGAFLTGMTEVYFDVTMAIIMAVSIGNFYEQKIKSRNNYVLSELTKEQVKEASVLSDGKTYNVEVSKLKPGDRMIVRQGERIPVDGTVIEGEATVNESLLTGESLPVNRKKGDRTIGGTIVSDGALVVEIGEKVKNTLDHLVNLMWDIQSSHPGYQRLADRIAGVFVPGVMLLAAGVVCYLLAGDHTLTESLLSGLAVLIVSCPCALGLATPMAIASGLREALKKNIVIRNVSLFEKGVHADIIAFDKTGTLTTGKMKVLDSGSDEEALAIARSIEQYSSHPVARAIVQTGDANSSAVSGFQNSPMGVSGKLNGREVYVGHPFWLEERGLLLSPYQREMSHKSGERARIPVGIGWEGVVRSVIEVGDELRPEWKDALDELKKEAREIAVITGDTQAAADQLRKNLDTELIFAQVKPDSKREIVRHLRKKGAVVMIGDGSNDAPALAEADLGIAFNSTAIAADSADIVVMAQDLRLIISALKIVRLTKSRIRQNLGWAFLYNLTAIPLAVAGLINPLFAALAMASSSLLVVINSSRSMNLNRK